MGLNPTILRQISPVASAIRSSQIKPPRAAPTAKRFSPRDPNRNFPVGSADDGMGGERSLPLLLVRALQEKRHNGLLCAGAGTMKRFQSQARSWRSQQRCASEQTYALSVEIAPSGGINQR